MSKPDYTEFDNALLEQIAQGRNTMMQLNSESSGLLKKAVPFCAKGRHGCLTPEFRVIDRRLQALRKRGLLRFNGKVWARIDRMGNEM